MPRLDVLWNETPKTEREQAMECLRQLEPHAPTWVKIVREYIRKLEDRCEAVDR